ncbi:MAG TPA: ribonuclease HI family protein [Gaiellaceae bacterium]
MRGEPIRRRPPRRAGRARSDAERRRLAQAAKEQPLCQRAGRPVLWCDGGARGNPGPSAFGYVLEAADGSLLAEVAEGLGVGTASVAEYRGLLAGLEAAARLGLSRLEVRMDSQLAIAQLDGEREVKNPTIARLVERARELEGVVGPVRWRWVRREHNARANALVAQALGMSD